MRSKALNISVWTAQVLVSIAFVLPAFTKSFTPFEELTVVNPWMNELTHGQIIAIGVFEFMGIVGMNLPFVLNRFKKIVPLAAAGLTMIMIGAIVFHIRREEYYFWFPLILGVLSLFVSLARRNLLYDEIRPEELVDEY